MSTSPNMPGRFLLTGIECDCRRCTWVRIGACDSNYVHSERPTRNMAVRNLVVVSWWSPEGRQSTPASTVPLRADRG